VQKIWWVQQAIQGLANLGAFKVVPKFAVVVPKLEEPHLLLLFETPAHMGGLCAMLPATRTTQPNGRHCAKPNLQGSSRKRYSSGFVAAKRRFHASIWFGARNE
jgi:hypothetical protein